MAKRSTNKPTDIAPRSKIEPSGRAQFPSQGYSLRWDEDGLHIQATDYHSGELTLDWKYLRALARAATRKSTKARG
jgi:hypothetical protein